MTPVEEALSRLLRRDALQLTAESSGDAEEIAGAIKEKTELIVELKRSLQLKEDVPDTLLVIALKNLIEKAGGNEALLKQIRELRKENESFRAERENKRHQDLILQGLHDGKITPATESWWRKLAPDQLAAHLEDAPVIIPQGALALETNCSERIDLTAEDKAACRYFGFTEDEFRTHKKALYQ